VFSDSFLDASQNAFDFFDRKRFPREKTDFGAPFSNNPREELIPGESVQKGG
jgi:hypothetical protein